MLLALKGLPLHAEVLLLQIEGKPIYLMNLQTFRSFCLIH